MLSSLLNHVPIERQRSTRVWHLLIATECFLHGLLLLCGAFLVVRRIQGAMTAPAGFTILVTTGIGLAVWIAYVTWRIRLRPEFKWLVHVAVGYSLAIAIAITLSNGSAVGACLLWGLILSVGGYGIWSQFTDFDRNETTPAKEIESISVEFDAADPSITQSITRRFDDDGSEVISGTIRCHFEPNERMRNAHIGFCPLLASAPEVFAEVVDGPDADVMVGQVLCTGVRFDVKIHQPAASKTSVLVEFYAKCAASGPLIA